MQYSNVHHLTQFSPLQPIQQEVIGYKPSVDTCNKLGTTYDTVIRETDQPIVAQPHIRSLEATMPKAGQVKQPVTDLDKSALYQEGMGFDWREMKDFYLNLCLTIYIQPCSAWNEYIEYYSTCTHDYRVCNRFFLN